MMGVVLLRRKLSNLKQSKLWKSKGWANSCLNTEKQCNRVIRVKKSKKNNRFRHRLKIKTINNSFKLSHILDPLNKFSKCSDNKSNWEALQLLSLLNKSKWLSHRKMCMILQRKVQTTNWWMMGCMTSMTLKRGVIVK
jgi:hypothetical protein